MTDHNQGAPTDVIIGALAFAVLIFFAIPDLIAWLGGFLVTWP